MTDNNKARIRKCEKSIFWSINIYIALMALAYLLGNHDPLEFVKFIGILFMYFLPLLLVSGMVANHSVMGAFSFFTFAWRSYTKELTRGFRRNK